MVKAKVYSTKTCPYCVQVKQYLDDKGVEYEEIDVSEDEEGRNRMVEKTNQMGVPVIEIDEEFIIGFDKNKLNELLKS